MWAFATSVLLLVLGALCNELLRLKRRIEQFGHELYTAKIRAMREVADAFGEIGRHWPQRTLEPLRRTLWTNAGFFPAPVREEMLRIAARTRYSHPDEVERVFKALIEIMRDDLGFPAIEQGFFHRVIQGIYARSRQH